MSYQKILVPIDFADRNRLAIDKARQIQRAGESELVLVHIVDYAPPDYVRKLLPDLLSSQDAMIEQASQQLSELADKEQLTNYQCVVRLGDARSVLLDVIAEQAADLVVIAKHNQTGLDRLAGSTTNRVVQHARCDVLVVHE